MPFSHDGESPWVELGVGLLYEGLKSEKSQTFVVLSTLKWSNQSVVIVVAYVNRF